MSQPNPSIGQIVLFYFSWSADRQKGDSDSVKARPCVVVRTRRSKDQTGFDVMLAPITHTKPGEKTSALAIPPVKTTGLDYAQSWIVTSEVNVTRWSDKDILPVKRSSWLYGHLPQGTARMAVQQIRMAQERGQLQSMDRRSLGEAENKPIYRAKARPPRDEGRER